MSEIVIKSRTENIFDIKLLNQMFDEFLIKDVMLLKFDSLQYRKAFQNRLIVSLNQVIERKFIKENYIEKSVEEDFYFVWDKFTIRGIDAFQYSIFITRPSHIYSRTQDLCYIGRLKEFINMENQIFKINKTKVFLQTDVVSKSQILRINPYA